MSERAEALARQLEQANDSFLREVEGINEEEWAAITPNEGWPVGVTAHHVAHNLFSLAWLAEQIAAGNAVPQVTPESRDQRNATFTERFAAVARADTLALLRTNGEKAAAIVRGIADEQLDRAAFIPTLGDVSAARMIVILLDHFPEHLASIRAARA